MKPRPRLSSRLWGTFEANSITRGSETLPSTNIRSSALVLFGLAPERPALDGRFPRLKCVVFGPLMPVVTAVAIMFGLQVRHKG